MLSCLQPPHCMCLAARDSTLSSYKAVCLASLPSVTAVTCKVALPAPCLIRHTSSSHISVYATTPCFNVTEHGAAAAECCHCLHTLCFLRLLAPAPAAAAVGSAHSPPPAASTMGGSPQWSDSFKVQPCSQQRQQHSACQRIANLQ